MIKSIVGLCAAVFFIVLSGCSDKSGSSKNNVEIEQGSIVVIDESWLEEKIKNRNNKILFINVWATWCAPCVEEFPDLVEIYNTYKDSDFEFLSISVDFPSEIESEIKPFLKEQKAVFPVVVAEEKRAEQIINSLNSDWSGAIPATFIYDANGEQKAFIIGVHSFEYFKRSIDSVREL